jgi:hypothetical protein
MKKYSVGWKYEQTEKHGGWAQFHRDDTTGPWKWHYVQQGMERRMGSYFTRQACEHEHRK